MTIWMVEQLGLAMMLRSRKPASASRLTSGTISGTSSSMRNCEVLSITTQPAAAARGACTLDTAAPGENRPRSKPSKSKSSSGRTVSTRSSPKLTSLPAEPLRCERHHLVHRKLPLGEDVQHLVPDRAGRADHRNSVAHVPQPASEVSVKRWRSGRRRQGHERQTGPFRLAGREAHASASVHHTGAWSEGALAARGARSIAQVSSRSTACADSSRWSILRP